jgi:hypothetical protein
MSVPVKTGKAQCEHIFSALPLRADIAQQTRHVRFVPKGDIHSSVDQWSWNTFFKSPLTPCLASRVATGSWPVCAP